MYICYKTQPCIPLVQAVEFDIAVDSTPSLCSSAILPQSGGFSRDILLYLAWAEPKAVVPTFCQLFFQKLYVLPLLWTTFIAKRTGLMFSCGFKLELDSEL